MPVSIIKVVANFLILILPIVTRNKNIYRSLQEEERNKKVEIYMVTIIKEEHEIILPPNFFYTHAHTYKK